MAHASFFFIHAAPTEQGAADLPQPWKYGGIPPGMFFFILLSNRPQVNIGEILFPGD